MQYPLREIYITQPYDAYSLMYPFWNFKHKGVDFRGSPADSVLAPASGLIVVARYQGGWGNLVVIQHDSVLTSYLAHLSKICVRVGDYVKVQQEIGRVGNTGFSTGPHLHWGVKKRGVWVNPLKYLIKPMPEPSKKLIPLFKLRFPKVNYRYYTTDDHERRECVKKWGFVDEGCIGFIYAPRHKK